MNAADTVKLRELAEAATSGPWRADGDRVCDGLCGEPVSYHDGSCCDHQRPVGCYVERHRDCGTVAREIENAHDAAFIAAASPQAIIALLDAIDGYRAPEAHWTYQQKIDDLEEKLIAMTRGLTEALDLADAYATEAIDRGGFRPEGGLERLAELRKLMPS